LIPQIFHQLQKGRYCPFYLSYIYGMCALRFILPVITYQRNLTKLLLLFLFFFPLLSIKLYYKTYSSNLLEIKPSYTFSCQLVTLALVTVIIRHHSVNNR
jgi:hypothetical protein